MADLNEAVAQFSSITGIATDQARFFVESAGGDLETAMSTFYETVGNTNLGAPTAVGGGQAQPTSSAQAQAPAAPAAATPSGPQTLGGAAAEQLPEAWRRPATGTAGAAGGNRGGTGMHGFKDLTSGGGPAPKTAGGGRIGTLNDVRSGGPSMPHGHSHDDDDDDDDDDEDFDPMRDVPNPSAGPGGSGGAGGPPDLYAGSGLNVQDPNANKKKPKGVVADILRQAEETGAGQMPQAPSAPSAAPRWFGGSANTLGSEDVPSRAIPDPTARPRSRPNPSFPTALAVPGGFPTTSAGGGQSSDSDEEPEEVERSLTFWADGFSIEDGPLMSYDDPKHAELLDAIRSGRAPLDVLGVKFNQKVTVRVAKRMNEKYVAPPKKPDKPFSGEGNRLGSPVPATLVGSSTGARGGGGGGGAVGSSEGRGPQPGGLSFEVDQNQPVTSVQIRLGDGSRMVTRFNHTHTVGDIRRQIQASNPALASRGYVLQTTFPSRDLTDDAQTIKEAGLAGAVVVQRFL